MTDELSAPLGLDKRKPGLSRLPRLAGVAVAGTLGAALFGLLAYVALVDDPLGGEPMVVVALNKAAPPAPDPTAASAKAAPSAETGAAQTGAAQAPAVGDKAAGPSVTVIDGLTGKRQQVTFGSGQDAKAIAVDPATAAKDGRGASGKPEPAVQSGGAAGVSVRAASPGELREASLSAKAGAAPGAPQVRTGDPAMLEQSRFGLLPKAAEDGRRPLEAYAAVADPAALRGAAPRIAIVLTRLGVSASTTTESLAKLPPAITLGVVPYAADLDRIVARARGEGREVLLQIPMEPFDFPDNDPGPQALMAGLPPEQNLDRLHGFLGRAQGYVGIAPYMGARFVAHEAAIAPVLRESASRGLLYFDDAGAPRAATAQVAAAHNAPFARADVALDATPTKGEIDAALRRLEALARERGFAIGAAAAAPVSVDRLAQWSKGLAARGFALVPLTALVNKPKSS